MPLKNNIDPFYIGSQMLREQLASIMTLPVDSYPPYNIKQTDDDMYLIEIAVAGFDKKDLEIILDANKLTIKGSHSQSDDDKSQTLYKGIASRPFSRVFAIADNIEVKHVALFNGILSIFLESMSKQKKPLKYIEIS